MRQETVHIGNYFNCPAYFTLKEGIKSQFCFSQAPFFSIFSIPKEAAKWDSSMSNTASVTSNAIKILIWVRLHQTQVLEPAARFWPVSGLIKISNRKVSGILPVCPSLLRSKSVQWHINRCFTYTALQVVSETAFTCLTLCFWILEQSFTWGQNLPVVQAFIVGTVPVSQAWLRKHWSTGRYKMESYVTSLLGWSCPAWCSFHLF